MLLIEFCALILEHTSPCVLGVSPTSMGAVGLNMLSEFDQTSGLVAGCNCAGGSGGRLGGGVRALEAFKIYIQHNI